MPNQTFIDGVGEVRLRDGIIRLDLLARSPTHRDDDGNPVPQFVDELVMSPHAFLRMTVALNGTLKEMREKGLFGAAEGEPKTAKAAKKPKAEAAQAKAEKAKKGGKAKAKQKKAKKATGGSPNF